MPAPALMTASAEAQTKTSGRRPRDAGFDAESHSEASESGRDAGRQYAVPGTAAGLGIRHAALQLRAAVQRRMDPDEMHAAASEGVSGPGDALPYLDRIQASFGAHDLSDVRAHIGGAAASASRAIGARAYATGRDVAFASQPDLHTAAHEAAHTVQQRAGVQLAGGVGASGDIYERQADAVAEAVVSGRSAADLLSSASPMALTGSGGAGLQRIDEEDPVAVSNAETENADICSQKEPTDSADSDRRLAVETGESVSLSPGLELEDVLLGTELADDNGIDDPDRLQRGQRSRVLNESRQNPTDQESSPLEQEREPGVPQFQDDYEIRAERNKNLNASERNATTPVNRTGDFNRGGSALAGNEYELVNNGGKYYVRRSPQATKDKNAVDAAGENSKSTKRASDRKFKGGVTGTYDIFSDDEPPKDRVFGPRGSGALSGADGSQLATEYRTGAFDIGRSGEVSVSREGIELNLGATAGASIVDGHLVYQRAPIAFWLYGQHLRFDFGVRISAEVAAKAEGNLAFQAGVSGGKATLNPSAGGEAFAGARAGLKLFGKLGWSSPGGFEDVVGGFVGAEGYAGIAAGVGLTARLAPTVKLEGYTAVAVGFGGGLRYGLDFNIVQTARLGYVLARRGLASAWQGLEPYAGRVADWLASGAARAIDGTAQVADAVSKAILADYEIIGVVERGLYRHMSIDDRAELIEGMLLGRCGNAEEDAILTILEHSKAQGEQWRLLSRIDGGRSSLDHSLQGEQQRRLDSVFE
jgi:hypothetical protein